MIIRVKVIRFVYLLIFIFILTWIFLQNFDWYWHRVYPLHYKDFIFHYATCNDLDPYLVAAIIFVESHFQPEAESSKGALGLMQILPSTARWAASLMNISITKDDLFDPETNIMIGCWYLHYLFKEFDGRLPRVLAAYNGGKGNVLRWMKEGIWNGTRDDIQNIPFIETRNYVLDVERVYSKYRNIYKKDK